MNTISKNRPLILVLLIITIIISIFAFSLIKGIDKTSLKPNYLITSEGDFQKIDGQEAKQEKLKTILYKSNEEVVSKFSTQGVKSIQDIKSYTLISKDFEEFNNRKDYTISYLPLKTLDIAEDDIKNYQNTSDIILFVPSFDQFYSKENPYFPYNVLKNIGDKKTFTLEDGKLLTMIRIDYAVKEDGKYFGLYTGNQALENYLNSMNSEQNKNSRNKLLEFENGNNKEKFETSVR